MISQFSQPLHEAKWLLLPAKGPLLLLLLMMGYTWLSASRSLLVQHVTLTETAVTRIELGPARRALRAEVLVPEGPAIFHTCRGPKPNDTIPHLRSVRQWRSSKARKEESVTLVTQLSLERLEMLENQCSVWPDPIAAAVYVPLVQGRIFSMEDPSLNGSSLEEAVARLSTFHGRMLEEGSCVLDLELATEDFSEEGEAGLYPFNAARNRALMLAQTEALLLLDTDFLPSPTIAAEWKTQEGYAELLRQLRRKQVIVLPAFETIDYGEEGKALAKAVVRGGKESVIREYYKSTLDGFHMRSYDEGHKYTNFPLWMSQDLPYAVDYIQGYEPYIMISRRFMPWYDERFRGYGRDKIQHMRHMAALNLTFSVHPTGFVMHVPHPKAPTYNVTWASGQWDRLYVLYKMVQKDIRKQRHIPVVSFPELCQ